MSRTQQLYLQHLAKTNASARVSGSSKSVGKSVGKATPYSSPGKTPVPSSRGPSKVPSSSGPTKSSLYSSKSPPSKGPETSPETLNPSTYYDASVSMTPQSPSSPPSPIIMSPGIESPSVEPSFTSGTRGWTSIRGASSRRSTFFEQPEPSRAPPAESPAVQAPTFKTKTIATPPLVQSSLTKYIPIKSGTKQSERVPVEQETPRAPEPVTPGTPEEEEEDNDSFDDTLDVLEQEVNYPNLDLSEANLVLNLDNETTRSGITNIVNEAASRYREEIQSRIDALTAELQKLRDELNNPKPPVILPATEPNITLAAQLNELSRQSKEAQDRARKAQEEARKARETAQEAEKKASAVPPVLDFSKIDNTDSINVLLQAMQSSTIDAMEQNQTLAEESNVRLAKLEQEVDELKTEAKTEAPPDSRVSTTAVPLFSKGQKLLRSFGDWGASKEAS